MNVLVMGSVTERLACAHVLGILLSQIALNLVGHSAPGGWMEYVLVTVFVLCMGFVAVRMQYRKILVATEAIVVRTVQFQLPIILDVVVKSTHVQVMVNAVLMAFVT